MTDEYAEKKQQLETLRLGFMGLMNIVMQSKSAHLQKQQALIRFDEAHMWLQNGIINYVEEPKPIQAATPADKENIGHHAVVDNEQDNQQEQIAVA
jgi:hypothetical protein